MDSLGGELRKVLRRGDEVLCLDGHPLHWHDVQRSIVVGPTAISVRHALTGATRLSIEDVAAYIYAEPSQGAPADVMLHAAVQSLLASMY